MRDDANLDWKKERRACGRGRRSRQHIPHAQGQVGNWGSGGTIESIIIVYFVIIIKTIKCHLKTYESVFLCYQATFLKYKRHQQQFVLTVVVAVIKVSQL